MILTLCENWYIDKSKVERLFDCFFKVLFTAITLFARDHHCLGN